MIARRKRLLGPAYRLFYEQPVQFVRGEGVWLYDPAGHRYLDAYNNVASVGHCHPHVVQAIARQAAVLNTHTRYLHETVLDYAEKLLATFPAEIGHVMFTCTGSEANDLALRVARTCTGGTGFIVTETAYHGVTSALAEMSPSLGLPLPKDSHVRLVPAPRSAGDDTGEIFARHVRQALDDMKPQRHSPRSAAGRHDLLERRRVRRSAGLPAPGGRSRARGRRPLHRRRSAARLRPHRRRRCGDLRATASCRTWSRMGKPMGNGHPVAGMAARPEVLAEFGARSRYFNTFGGNPVSAAAGIAVLEVIEREGLIENARRIGAYLAEQLRRAAGAARADRRGPRRRPVHRRRAAARRHGAPATSETARIVNMLRERRVLISAAGPHGNVLKIRPPLVFGTEHADLLVENLDQVLQALHASAD